VPFLLKEPPLMIWSVLEMDTVFPFSGEEVISNLLRERSYAFRAIQNGLRTGATLCNGQTRGIQGDIERCIPAYAFSVSRLIQRLPDKSFKGMYDLFGNDLIEKQGSSNYTLLVPLSKLLLTGAFSPQHFLKRTMK
jgi:hypothetical protein